MIVDKHKYFKTINQELFIASKIAFLISNSNNF